MTEVDGPSIGKVLEIVSEIYRIQAGIIELQEEIVEKLNNLSREDYGIQVPTDYED